MIQKELERQVLSLSDEDRVQLVELLWESLATSDARARAEKWAAEAERRLDAVQSGRLPLFDAATVFEEMRDSLRR